MYVGCLSFLLPLCHSWLLVIWYWKRAKATPSRNSCSISLGILSCGRKFCSTYFLVQLLQSNQAHFAATRSITYSRALKWQVRSLKMYLKLLTKQNTNREQQLSFNYTSWINPIKFILYIVIAQQLFMPSCQRVNLILNRKMANEIQVLGSWKISPYFSKSVESSGAAVIHPVAGNSHDYC